MRREQGVDDRGGSDAACRCGEQRRTFLQDATVILAGVFASLGLPPAEARVLPVRWGDALGLDRQEATYSIPAADGATIDAANQVILVRFQNRVYAFSLACPHENTALRWLARENRFRCPRHESRYQPDGVFVSGRATRNMDRLPIRRAGAAVVVDLVNMFRSDKDKAAWDAAAVTL
jgi:nitrite reductase/ring-hydroxylating ferredoxin subunit